MKLTNMPLAQLLCRHRPPPPRSTPLLIVEPPLEHLAREPPPQVSDHERLGSGEALDRVWDGEDQAIALDNHAQPEPHLPVLGALKDVEGARQAADSGRGRNAVVFGDAAAPRREDLGAVLREGADEELLLGGANLVRQLEDPQVKAPLLALVLVALEDLALNHLIVEVAVNRQQHAQVAELLLQDRVRLGHYAEVGPGEHHQAAVVGSRHRLTPVLANVGEERSLPERVSHAEQEHLLLAYGRLSIVHQVEVMLDVDAPLHHQVHLSPHLLCEVDGLTPNECLQRHSREQAPQALFIQPVEKR
mmetsp:Transcript_21473/g.53956  ORF Transcript_21473/g.53956 Transcript_21473/m.53956 type:complete len:304 (-) Transcript_21473:1702-2613(-)